MHSNFNKLALKISENLWFDTFARHSQNDAPYKYFVEAGLRYPFRNMKVKLNISEPLVDAKEYNGEIFFHSDRKASTIFNIAKGNEASIDYVLTSTTSLPNMKPIKLK